MNRIIDFHLHFFPDALAAKAIQALCERAKSEPYTDGTLSDTLRVMDEWNTDYAVSLNIAVQPKSVSKVNDFAIQSDGGRIISFGSVHPYNINWDSELERLKSSGIKGIKLHPEYQEFDVDCKEALNIYRKCGELGIIVLLHCGKDIAYPDTLRSGPIALARISDLMPETKFVFAHMGAQCCWEEVIRYISGRQNVWLDTAYSARSMDKEIFMRVAASHGLDRILYATDCPWESGIYTQELIASLGYTKEEINGIMFNNAYKLLGGLNG